MDVSNMLLILLVLSVSSDKSSDQCPGKSQNYNPRFVREPPRTISGIESQYLCAECCVDGFSSLQWNFRNLGDKLWEPVSGQYVNGIDRSMCLTRPHISLDIGFYQCLAKDDYGRNVSREIFIYLLNPDEPKTIVPITPTSSSPSGYSIGDRVDFNCSSRTYLPKEPINVLWLHKVQNSFLPISRSNKVVTVIETYLNRSEETNPDLVNIISIFTMEGVTKFDTGEYKCQMKQSNVTEEQIFAVYIYDNRLNVVLLVSLIIAVVLTLLLFTSLWYSRYSILVLYKTYFSIFVWNWDKDIEVSVLYQDGDMLSAKLALEIVNVLEKYKFHCWLFDRDKSYGQDIILDQMKVLGISHTVLVLISGDSIENPNLLTNLSTIERNPSVKRLYLFIPSTRQILKSIRNSSSSTEKWLRQELNLQSFFQRHSYSIDPSGATKSNKLFAWIISTLPSTIIRAARQRLKQEAKDISV